MALWWILLLYPTLLAGRLAVCALAAMENRFVLPVVTALLPLAGWALVVHSRRARFKLPLFGAFFGYLAVAWKLSQFVSSLAR